MSRFTAGLGFASIGNQFDVAGGYAFGFIYGNGPFDGNAYFFQNEPHDLLNSDTIICWGANPAVSQVQVMHFILEAKSKGSKYIVIDTVFNANASKADNFILVNPGSDGALALGILNAVFENGWINESFVRNHTTAPLLVNQKTKKLVRMSDFGVEPTVVADPLTGKEIVDDPYVVYDEAVSDFVAVGEASKPAFTGISDCKGIPVITAYDNLVNISREYTAERVTEITGVSADDIEMLAKEYASDRKINTYLMLGINQYTNAHYAYWCIATVSLMTGHVGTPGNACGWGEANPYNGNFAATGGLDVNGNPLKGNGASYNINTINEVLETGTYGGWSVSEPYNESVAASNNVDVTKGGNPTAPLKSIYVQCSNPAAIHPDHEYVTKWLKGIEFLVVAELSMTETAKYADILLPVAHWFEQDDMFSWFHTHLYWLFNEKAIEPLGEARSDFDILKELASRLGHPEIIGDMNPRDFIKMYMDTDSLAQLGATYEVFERDKVIRFVPEGDFITAPGGSFWSATGRASIYNEAPMPLYDIGQRIDYDRELAPHWEPALEADVNSEARKTYPFALIQERMRTRTHSQWWDVGYLTELYSEPSVKINPVDAAEKGIKDDDTVRIFNDRGSVTLKAYIDGGIPKGVLAASRSWQAEEQIEGHMQSLLHNGYNQMITNVALNDVACDVEII